MNITEVLCLYELQKDRCATLKSAVGLFEVGALVQFMNMNGPPRELWCTLSP